MSLGPSPATVAPHISDATALILAAQPIVNCCDATGLEALSAETGIPLIVDSVESAYESCQGRRVGGFGQAEIFSMHASKLINAMEGGYVTTASAPLARRLRLLRGFAYDGQDNVTELGLNAKLNEVHAAMALASLDALPEQIAHNRAVYDAYRRGLADLPGLRVLEFDATQQCSYQTSSSSSATTGASAGMRPFRC